MGMSFFATAPRGAIEPLAAELHAMGAERVRVRGAGVAFAGELTAGYRACLWSRTASRVLMRIAQFRVAGADDLYEGTRGILWREHLGPDDTLAVDVTSVDASLGHEHYAVQRVKDAIVDQFRDALGRRPNVQRRRPRVRINVHVYRDRATVSLDLAGESLHRRGYRGPGAPAPLKENLAAAVLQLAGWPELAATRAALLDPLCGSGTLVVEGAWMAADVAPGLDRDYFGFLGWRGHQPERWHELLAEARERRRVGLASLAPIFASDSDAGAVKAAHASLVAAGLREHVRLERRCLEQLEPPATPSGLVVANPPYGERMGRAEDLSRLYDRLGSMLKTRFHAWHAAVLLADSAPSTLFPRASARRHGLHNGAIPCHLLVFEPCAGPPVRPGPARVGASHRHLRAEANAITTDRQTQMFANRLHKKLRRVGRRARREGVDCYRVYDADMPEFALAIDLYRGEHLWVHVQEYEAPATVDAAQARARREAALRVTQDLLGVAREAIHLKRRRRRGARDQYEKLGATGRLREVREGECRLLVNFDDYLDTGLFLDQRSVRSMLRSSVGRGRFLNLFAYTGAASVHAAAGGARSTVSVDLSATYTEWARRNLELNGFREPEHTVVRAECTSWLEDNAPPGVEESFDLVYVAPPTFSNSTATARDFDVQRDHVALIRAVQRLLAIGGVMIFSTHRRRFRLEEQALEGLRIEEITRLTIPFDFERRRAHRCWRLTRTEQT